MNEYIDKKQAIDRIASCYCMDCEHSNGILCRACEHQDDMDLIDDMPAVDVQPVRHGRWIDHEKFERKNCNVCIECSVCNTWFGHDCIPKTKFCPNCGARMDLKDGDTNG